MTVAAPTGSKVIASYEPRTMPAAAGAFARSVVTVVDPPNASRAKALLWCCARLATFGMGVGLEPSAQVLLHPSVIERFVIVGTAQLSGATRRTLRTNLRYVAERVNASGPAAVALSRERAKSPYTDAQIAAYLGLVDTQPTPGRRMRAQALVCLGAGAGLMGADLRRARGFDVRSSHGGMVVVIAGRRPRVVPVLARYHDRLAASASFAGDGWLIGGVDPMRHNVTTPLISSLAGGADLGRLDTGRLRATWLCTIAETIGLRAFLDAAGITCSQRLGDLIGHLGVPLEAEAVAILGGAR